MIALRIPKGDLALEGGSPVWIGESLYARQRIEVTSEFFLGEFFLNLLEGIPYHRDVLIKNPNPDTVRSVFRRAFLNTPGIVAIRNLTYTPNFETRVADIDFEAEYRDGATIPLHLELIL